MKFTKSILLALLLLFTFTQIDCYAIPKVKAKAAKKGVVSKVKDAAAYGFGWQLGKEAAKATIKKGSEVLSSPKTKENIKKVKEKTIQKIEEIKKKD